MAGFSSIEDQITNLIGEATSGDIGITGQMITDWASMSKRTIINLMPTHLLGAFSIDSGDQTSNGYSTVVNKIHKVVRENGTDGEYVECKRIGSRQAFQASKIATSDDPYFYDDVGKIYVIPDPGVSPNAFKVFEPDMSYVNASLTSISNFPDELLNAVVYFTVSEAKLRESGVMRRMAEDEMDKVAAYVAGATYTKIQTALNASTDEIDKITAIIDLANAEFDKISALLDLGETDTETNINTALSAITTASGRINTAVLLANAEFDNVAAQIDTASTTISNADTEDVQRGTAELSVAASRVQNGMAYISEAQEGAQEAQTYFNEVSARLSQASAKREEGSARIQNGMSYINEASSRLNNANGYLSEANNRAGAASMEINSYLSVSGQYFSQSGSAAKEASVFKKKFDQEVAIYIGGGDVDNA